MNNTANSFRRRLQHLGRVLLFAAFIAQFVHTGCGAEKTKPDVNAPRSTSPTQTVMKIRLKLEDKVLTATLNDSKTARDFVAQLPLTLSGLVILGKIDGGIEALSGLKPLKVTIEVASSP